MQFETEDSRIGRLFLLTKILGIRQNEEHRIWKPFLNVFHDEAHKNINYCTPLDFHKNNLEGISIEFSKMSKWLKKDEVREFLKYHPMILNYNEFENDFSVSYD